jgi:class 3 adenylate cyclase
MEIPQFKHFPAFSMIVDVNSFTALVAKHELGAGVAQFVRDILAGPIAVVEEAGGSVIGVNGDAIFAILPDAESTFMACAGIAKDLNRTCEYLADTDYITSIPAPPSLKIGVEYGTLDSSTITTKALGSIPFCIGPATNYAARIIAAGEGNRCHIGPAAFDAGMDAWLSRKTIQEVAGKRDEPAYSYYVLDLGDIWIEGQGDDGEFYW